MDIPSNRNRLAVLFSRATLPDPADLAGIFHVEMITGVPSLRRLNHRKWIYTRAGQYVGCNILFRDYRWGRFQLQTAKDPWDKEPSVLINYDVPLNGGLTRRMRDHVRCLVPFDTYLGRFSYTVADKLRFVGYFSLRRVTG